RRSPGEREAMGAVRHHSVSPLGRHGPFSPLLLGRSPQDDESCMGEQAQGDVPIPARPGADFILTQAPLALGFLQTRLDPPPLARYPHQVRKRGLWWPPDPIVGTLAGLGQAPPDQDPPAP